MKICVGYKTCVCVLYQNFRGDGTYAIPPKISPNSLLLMYLCQILGRMEDWPSPSITFWADTSPMVDARRLLRARAILLFQESSRRIIAFHVE